MAGLGLPLSNKIRHGSLGLDLASRGVAGRRYVSAGLGMAWCGGIGLGKFGYGKAMCVMTWSGPACFGGGEAR